MAKGTVVLHAARAPDFWRRHEGTTLRTVAESIAQLKGCDFGGHYDADAGCDRALFFVPVDTLLEAEAAALGIRSARDLFGGIVPRAFVRTKIITHELVSAAAERPDGWSVGFARRSRDVVLPGYSVFGGADAREAVRRLLGTGLVRAKLPRAAGAREQQTLRDLDDLETLLEAVPESDLAEHGLLFEVNLDPVHTLSVGHVTVNDASVAYHGRQWLCRDNTGRSVYGGSELTCVRGDWDALERLDVADGVRCAIRQARAYDEATEEYGLVASRRNYDVGQGRDPAGRWHSGVFEASWRFGGASPAEIAALQAFAERPDLDGVQVSTVEAYGADATPPAGAIVHFHGIDELDGPLVRYTLVGRALERAA
jgi:hypothetical protein